MTVDRKKRVLLAMSGGVDSSVAALLLRKQGYEVIGGTMVLFEKELTDSVAARDAAEVCKKLSIEHHVFDFREIFAKEVIEPFGREYQNGRTPNPCIFCNRALKFGALLEAADQLSCEYLSTGHYARVEKASDGYFKIRRPEHARKEQSYVLYSLGQKELSRLLLPCGDYDKSEIRKMAEEAGLSVAHKADSQDICFIPNGAHASYLSERFGAMPEGNFVDDEGKVLGKHKGLWHYTLGQRKGLGLSLPASLYVSTISPLDHTVTLSPEAKLFHDTLHASRLCLAWPREEKEIEILAQVRYNAKPAPATLIIENEGNCTVRFHQQERAITPGQTVVFYEKNYLLGGATIETVL